MTQQFDNFHSILANLPTDHAETYFKQKISAEKCSLITKNKLKMSAEECS